MIPRALTIAGSDSSGGAGIQADLKTFTVFRVYGMSAITALTAQNTCGVVGVHVVPPEFVAAQIDAVVRDCGPAPTKTGMLATAEIVEVVAKAVRGFQLQPLVVDPVVVSQSGARLLEEDAVRALRKHLLPLASLVTPNILEAEALLGFPIRTLDAMREAARAFVQAGAGACLLKGGHLEGPLASDVFDDGHEQIVLEAPRRDTPHTHGTGCQLSAAIVASLARGASLPDAVRIAKQFITVAIDAGLPIGKGNGPANPLAWLDQSENSNQQSRPHSTRRLR